MPNTKRDNPLKFLRKWRTHRGMSQTVLANEIGTTKSAISDMETGRTSPTVKTVAKIAAALGCKIGDLFDTEPGSGDTNEWSVLFEALDIDRQNAAIEMMRGLLAAQDETVAGREIAKIAGRKTKAHTIHEPYRTR